MRSSPRVFAGAAVAGGAIGIPTVVPSSALGFEGNTPPSDRITMGLIGCGSHGRGWNIDMMFANPAQQIIAVSDIDKTYMDEAQKKVDDFYSAKAGSGYKACAATAISATW